MIAFIILSVAHGQEVYIQPYLQALTSDTVWIMWEDDQPDTTNILWGLDTSLGFETTGNAIEITSGHYLHSVQISGLTSDTDYFYRSVFQTTPNLFHTPSETSEEDNLTFVAMSDMQIDHSNPTKFTEIVNDGVISYFQDDLGSSVSLANAIDAVLIPGDLVENGSSHSQWTDDFFAQASELLAQVPVYPVPGNHEYDSQYFFDYFILPENGTPGYEEHWWSSNLSNIHIIGLDSNSSYRLELQLNWLEADLAEICDEPTVDFVFAQLHHPHQSELWIAGNTSFTGEVIAILEQFSTDCGKPSIHFYGHTHGYSRGQSRDQNHVMVNVATSGGNIDYWGEYAQTDYSEYSVSQDEWGFVLVDVQAGTDPQFTLQRISRGNENQQRENELRDQLTVRLLNLQPDKPTGLFPIEEQVSPDCLYLVGSPFQDADQDLHGASHWQVSTDCTDFTSPVYEQWRQHENWYAGIDTQANDDLQNEQITLQPNEDYCWRVRYRDQSLSWSEWSQTYEFSTASSSNLLSNPGAENGTDSWTLLEGNLESLTDGECNGVSPYIGDRYFSIGGLCEESSYAKAIQRIDLQSLQTEISTGNALAIISASMRNWDGSDQPTLDVLFFNDQEEELISSSQLTTLESTWTTLQTEVSVPTDAVTAEVQISGTRNSGEDNDSYMDALSLIITTQEEQNCAGEDITDDTDDPDDTDPQEPTSEPTSEPSTDPVDNSSTDDIKAGCLVYSPREMIISWLFVLIVMRRRR
jgi:acid phosphatase type 7